MNKMQRGQAFLGLVLLIGGLALAVGITLAVVFNSVIDTAYGYRALTQAQAVATSGAEDALLQLDRNSNFTAAPPGYSVAVGSSTATVTVAAGAPSAGFDTITSAATVAGRVRKVSVVVAVNASTSQVSIVSWQIVQ